jgi:hypothetical protein
MVKREGYSQNLYNFFLDELDSYFNSLILDKWLIYNKCIQF